MQSKEALDKLLAELSEEELDELARANKARYMRDYYARKELEKRIAIAEGKADATV